MTTMKSTVEESSKQIREQFSAQRTDAEIAQNATTMMLIDYVDEVCGNLGIQIDVNSLDIDDLKKTLRQVDENSSSIKSLKKQIRKLAGLESQAHRHRERPALDPIDPDKKKRIDKYIEGSEVTPLGLSETSSNADDFDKLDQLAATGKMDADGNIIK